MTNRNNPLEIPLPHGWPQRVKLAMLHVVSLAQFALAYTRGWAANGQVARVRLKADNDQLRQHLALLTEEIRIKDARMKRVAALNRPHYAPTERMSILEPRAARAWSTQQTADAFLITPATIAYWMKRLDEDGPDALVRTPKPVNKFPDFVRYAVQRLRALCPGLGKVNIAEVLCRAATCISVRRRSDGSSRKRRLQSLGRYLQRQVGWSLRESRIMSGMHIDLTAVPTGGGFWAPWSPLALPQCWPFC